MADEVTAAPSVTSTVINRVSSATVGQTAIGGGTVISISAILSWAFSCWIARKIEMPNEQTLEAMSLGFVLASHGFEKLLARGKSRRATDTQGATS